MIKDIFPNYTPQHLELHEISNPILVLNDLFHNQMSFPMWRNDLYQLFKGIFSNTPMWTGRSPADMLYNLEQFEKLLEIAWLLYHQKPRPPKLEEVNKEDIIPANAKDCNLLHYWKWDYYPRWLNIEELKQPYLVLDNFFSKSSLLEWKLEMYEWVKRSLSSYFEERNECYEVIISFEHLNKLLEATYIIYIRSINRASNEEGLTDKII